MVIFAIEFGVANGRKTTYCTFIVYMSRSIHVHSKTTSQTVWSTMIDSAICHSMCAFMVFIHQLHLFVFWVSHLTGTAGIIKPLAKALEIHKSQLE